MQSERETSQVGQAPYGSRGYMGYVLFLLLVVYTLYAMDRSIVLVLVESIKNDLNLTDTQMGIIIGPAFSIFYAIAGVPLGLLADRINRRNMIAFVVGAWSIATGLCGAANNFIQLAFARAAVGLGESGGAPASMAMISDIFPANWRASALSVFYLGGSIGAALAFAGGSWAAAHFGWRTALWLAAVPGLVVSALIYFTVREPVRGLSDNQAGPASKTSIRETFAFIIRQRAVVQVILGLIFLHMVGNGLMAFVSSFLIRSHDMALSEVGGMISLLKVLTTPISMIAAGLLADYLGRYDVRWRLRLGPLGAVLSAAAMCMMTLVESKTAVAVCFAIWAFSGGLYQAPLYALLQNMVKPHMRATIGSIQFVLTAAIGGALGPLLVGTLSDFLAPRFGTDSLRYALFFLGLFYIWAAMHFILGERHLKGNLMRAEQA